MILTLKPAASRPHYAFDRRTWRPTGLKAYPSLPPGYDGWYVFPKSGR